MALFNIMPINWYSDKRTMGILQEEDKMKYLITSLLIIWGIVVSVWLACYISWWFTEGRYYDD